MGYLDADSASQADEDAEEHEADLFDVFFFGGSPHDGFDVHGP
jgi:hypothetical protein